MPVILSPSLPLPPALPDAILHLPIDTPIWCNQHSDAELESSSHGLWVSSTPNPPPLPQLLITYKEENNTQTKVKNRREISGLGIAGSCSYTNDALRPKSYFMTLRQSSHRLCHMADNIAVSHGYIIEMLKLTLLLLSSAYNIILQMKIFQREVTCSTLHSRCK